MSRHTKRILLLGILLAFATVIEAKGKSRGRQSEEDEYWKGYKSFVEDGTEEILSIGTLILLVVYFIYDSKKQNQSGQGSS